MSTFPLTPPHLCELNAQCTTQPCMNLPRHRRPHPHSSTQHRTDTRHQSHRIETCVKTKTGPYRPKTPLERHNRESSRANRSLLRLAGFAHLSLSKVTHQSRKFIPALLIALTLGVFTSTPPTAIYETAEISSAPHVSAIYKAGPTLNTVAGDLIGALHDMLQGRPGNLHQQTQTRHERDATGGGPGRRPQQGRAGSRTRPAKQCHASWPGAVEPARQTGGRASGRDTLSTPRQGTTRKPCSTKTPSVGQDAPPRNNQRPAPGHGERRGWWASDRWA